MCTGEESRSNTAQDGIGRYIFSSRNVYDGNFVNGDFDGEGNLHHLNRPCFRAFVLPLKFFLRVSYFFNALNENTD